MLIGCDISHYQKIDWTTFKPDFVICKCSEGLTFKDATYETNKSNARKNGIPFGSYHFADGNDPIKEADFFLTMVGDIQEGELISLDAETGEDLSWCKTFMDYVTSKVGFKPILYAPVGGWIVSLDCPLWVARYGVNDGNINYNQPPNIGHWSNYAIWQYTSRGKEDGCSGNIDLDLFNGTLDDFKKLGKPAGDFIPASTKPMLVIYSQQDPRWAQIKLGESVCTMGKYGCVTTDLAMAYNWLYGGGLSPLQCEQKLSYTLDGLIFWASLKNIKMNLVNRFRIRDDAVIQEALINPNEICLIEVNHNHWLFLIGRKLPVLGWKVADPWHGDTCYTNRYQNNITGGAVISKI